MPDVTPDNTTSPDPTGDLPARDPSEQPNRRERERSGILGEPANAGPDAVDASDGSERDDPLLEQVPHDGVDHWRR